MTQQYEKEKNVNQILDLADALWATLRDFLHEEIDWEESIIEMKDSDQFELFGEYWFIIGYSNDTHN